ncbi:MAG TPA: hypothetical protein VMV00_02640 [Candidatus Baltobacteraceae bacterium]|nr:hypothetical protein [Candidatus Baltobacteraceae bacterium]
MARQSRAQSAMEYLMTYGWAILIIAVALAILYQLGIFGGGSNLLSTSCLASTGFLCTNIQMNTTGNVIISFAQSTGQDITITGIACTNTTASPSSMQSVTQTPIAPGQQTPLIFSCILGSNTIGTTFSGTLWVQYNTQTQDGNIGKVGAITAVASTAKGVSATTTITTTTTTTSSTSTSTTSTTTIFTATGGTVTYAGGKEIHTFTVNGVFTVTGNGGTVSANVVGDGGGGGNGACSNGPGGGGGGSGGDTSDSVMLTTQTYNVIVGAGGGGASAGSGSSFAGLSGGGGGGGANGGCSNYYGGQAGAAGTPNGNPGQAAGTGVGGAGGASVYGGYGIGGAGAGQCVCGGSNGGAGVVVISFNALGNGNP